MAQSPKIETIINPKEQPPVEHSETPPVVAELPPNAEEQTEQSLVESETPTTSADPTDADLLRAFITSLTPEEAQLLDIFATNANPVAPSWFKPIIEPCPRGSNEAVAREWQERKVRERDLQWPYAFAIAQIKQRRSLLT